MPPVRRDLADSAVSRRGGAISSSRSRSARPDRGAGRALRWMGRARPALPRPAAGPRRRRRL